MPQPKEELYTVDYIENLPDGERAELIDGVVYNMGTPSYTHQAIVYELGRQLGNAIEKNKGECKVVPAPFTVYLNKDEYTHIEPDLSLICDRSKITDKGCCNGAPELVMEVVSPSSKKLDYFIKLNKYINAGVFEYWIIDPIEKQILVYLKNNDFIPKVYRIEDTISVGIIKNCKLKLDLNSL